MKNRLSKNSQQFISSLERQLGDVFEKNSIVSPEDFPVYKQKNGEIIKLWMKNIRLRSLDDIPRLETLRNLKFIDLANNDLINLFGLSSPPNLEILRVHDNRINSLKELSRLRNLRILDVSNNNLTSMKGIGGLSKLEDLNLSHNSIFVMSRLHNLKFLKKLNLSYNNIKSIKCIDTLSQLEYLELNNNKITSIPSSIENLHNLFKLNIHNNKISYLPQNLLKLKDLLKFNFDNNSLYYPEEKKFRTLKVFVKWNQKEKLEFLEHTWDKIQHNRPLTLIEQKNPLFTQFFPGYSNFNQDKYRIWKPQIILDKLTSNQDPSGLDLQHYLFIRHWRRIVDLIELNYVDNIASRKFISYLYSRFSIKKDGGFMVLL